MPSLLAVLGLALAVGGGAGSFQAPQVDRIDPIGGQRGTEVTVQFLGQRLFEPQDLMLVKTGIEVLDVAGEKPDRCTVRLRLAPDCPLGSHVMRLRTAFGISNIVMFQVGALPEVTEQQLSGTLQVVPLDCTINGHLIAEEVDRYLVELAAGASVQCEVQGIRLGASAVDLALSVIGPDKVEIASADDTVLGIKDPMLSFVAERAGFHILEVRTAYTDRRNAGAYRLHVGSFPRPAGCLPCGGQPGEELEVTLLGASGRTVHVQLPDDPLPDALDQRFRFYPEDENGIAPTPILLRVGGPPNRTPTIDDKDRAWVEFPASVHGVLAQPNETARFYFKAKKGTTWEFRCVARSLRSPLDPTLTVRQASGRYVGYNDDSAGADSVLRFNAGADGDYRIEVRDLLRRGGPDYFFRLEGGVRKRRPTLRMVVGREDEAVLSVARGNRKGAVLQWANLDPKKELELLARNLPAGVTATFGPVQRGTNLVPLVLTAAADAEPSGSQAGFAVRAAAEPEGHDLSYAQYVTLVTARNNQPLLGTISRQLPVAVTEPAPFAVRIEPPAVPIVRGAPLYLQVHVERAEGFKAPIRVNALWRTPGLSSGQIVIDGKSDHGALPLNANSGAMLGRFPVAVTAQAASRGGTVELCSDFVELHVDKPWITAKPGKARTEPGVATELRVKLGKERTLPGPGKARLLGLPRGVSSEPIAFGIDEGELMFALQVAANAAPGRHRSFLVQLLVPAGPPAETEATVEHRFGGGEIRIDRPVKKTKVGEERP